MIISSLMRIVICVRKQVEVQKIHLVLPSLNIGRNRLHLCPFAHSEMSQVLRKAMSSYHTILWLWTFVTGSSHMFSDSLFKKSALSANDRKKKSINLKFLQVNLPVDLLQDNSVHVCTSSATYTRVAVFSTGNASEALMCGVCWPGHRIP